jgi:peptidoglycan/xylan/chitin deacetylase (PgdA/CDA1 family)
MSSKVTIVMYHYVRDLSSSRYPNIKGLDTKKFKNQIQFLINNYSIIKMEDLLDSLKYNTKLPKNAALLTFDDGYIDHYTQVLPILLENHIQGSFFIPSRLIKESVLLDVNKIHFILEVCKDTTKLVSYIFSRLDHYRVDYKLESNEYYYNKLAVNNRYDDKDIIFVKRILQNELSLNLRKIILDEIFIVFLDVSENILSSELYLTFDQIKMMKNCGMFIGAHGHNHYWFESLSEFEQIEEIEGSISFLDEIGVNKEHRTMCYPYGSYNNTTVRLLKEYGFQCAVTTIPEIADIIKNNCFILPRLDTNDFPIT